MKYVFIEKHQAEFSIKAMCRVLRVARSGWYTWCQRRTRISTRQQFRQHCDSVVLAAFTRSKQRYGAPRLTDELRAQGYPFNVKTVAASLRRQGLRAKASRKFSPVSYRAHGLPVSENLLEQDFYASGPNQKWAGDITYLRTDEGWLYLAVVIDLWSRARRYLELHDEIADLDVMIAAIVDELAPELIKRNAIGYESASQLLITAGDNPQRLRSESGFAALCGVSPVPVSSGKTNRYRLNRGGDRAANSALHIIAIGRLRTDAKTKEYVARRVAEGHTKMEAIRCLKRYISREVYTLLRNQNRRINSIPITA